MKENIIYLCLECLFILTFVIIIFFERKGKYKHLEIAKDNLNELDRTFQLMCHYYPQEKISEEEYERIKNIAINNYMIIGGGLDNECCGKEYLVKLVGTEELDSCYYYKCSECGKIYVCVWAQLLTFLTHCEIVESYQIGGIDLWLFPV